MSIRILLVLALLAWSNLAAAQNTRVLLDTDRGPILLELDSVRAPITSTNFLRYVDDGVYSATLLHRVVKDFVVQGGGFKDTGLPVSRYPTIASERNNGLLNVPGTIAMALSGNPPAVNSASSDFFFNTGTNTSLNGNFTVFGRVVFGTKTLASINTTPIISGTEQPVRIPLIKRAVRVAADQFPILPIHTGTWYDPANSGKGFFIEVAQASGSETGPNVIVSWYDFYQGRQIWLVGIAPFAWGASSVEVPMQISEGGQFGSAFAPGQVTSNANWGRLTLRFTGCGAGSFSYTSSYGDGTIPVRSLTLPTNESCVGN